jgi:plasmid stabilization system protein ParE
MMPPTPVEFHPEAIAEAVAAANWYRERSPRAGEAFLFEIDHAVDRIAEAPEAWPPYLYGTHRFLLRRFPFSVVYRRISNTIQIIALAHGRRRPGYWKGR